MTPSPGGPNASVDRKKALKGYVEKRRGCASMRLDMAVDQSFEAERKQNLADLGNDEALASHTSAWMSLAQEHRYSYNFDWLGLPIIQYPQDIVAMQEIVWRVQPNLIIETGIARGGSAIFYASLLELVETCGGEAGRVLAIDVDIRPPNRQAIEAHPLSRRIEMIEGSSTDPAVVDRVRATAEGESRVLVCLDSNHTHDHVLAELRAYAPLVSVGSYAVVFDTLIEDLSSAAIGDRPWGKGNNPKTAVHAFLRETDGFEIDTSIQTKLQVTVGMDGFLKRIRAAETQE